MPEEVEPKEEVKEKVEKPTMDFSEAVQALKDRKEVQRPGDGYSYKVFDSSGKPAVFRVYPNGSRQFCALPGMESPYIDDEVLPAEKVYIEKE